MDPWVDGSPLTRANHPFLRARAFKAAGPDAAATPRMTEGRVVVQRGRWLMPSTAFPVPADGEGTTSYLIRLDEWRLRRAMPGEVFFVAVGHDPLDANHRKPMWLDFASSHSVYTALRLISRSQTLRLEEALPGRHQAWVAGSDGPRMCEHVSFAAWPRPQGHRS